MSAQNPFNRYFNPKSIAVVGASRSPEKVGYQILKNLIDGGYKGHIYPINPNADHILKLKCYPTLTKVRKQIDVAVIVTPAPLVATILKECAQNHISNVIIISAGFSESGSKGSALQQELSHELAHLNLNVLGPNCLGCLSPINHLNATFGPKLPTAGSIMLVSQSGALVTGIIDWANKMDIGLSHAVTFGNRIGVGEIEALEFAAKDKNTKAVLVYLESFQNAPKFFSACSKLTPKKPIILLKGGQSLAGQTASASHTAALASNYVLTKAFADQTGVIVANTIQEWLNLASAFAHVPPAKSKNLTLVTNAGGPGVLSTDEAVSLGLQMPELSSLTKQKLSAALPRLNPHNPLDLLGDASPEDFQTALAILKTDKAVDNLLVIVTPQTTTKPLETAQAIIDSKLHRTIPLYTVLIGGEKMATARKSLNKHHLLTYTFPTQPLQIIASKTEYETTRTDVSIFPSKTTHYISTETLMQLKQLLKAPLTIATAFKILTRFGFTLPKSAVITSIDQVAKALSYVGRPAVVKTAGMNILHKAKVGGVCLNLMTGSVASLAFRKLRLLHPEVLFQQTIKGEIEIIIGAKKDPQLGPFVTVGFGGTLTNTLDDRAYAFIPTSKKYMNQAFAQTKAAKMMKEKGVPTEPIIDAMMRLSSIIEAFDEIDELEINPAIMTDKRLYAADIKITLRK